MGLDVVHYVGLDVGHTVGLSLCADVALGACPRPIPRCSVQPPSSPG